MGQQHFSMTDSLTSATDIAIYFTIVVYFSLCRSVIVENAASSTSATEILKPVKKRKRKDYQSPSEEDYESEQMVGRRQGKHVYAHISVTVWSSHQCFSVPY